MRFLADAFFFAGAGAAGSSGLSGGRLLFEVVADSRAEVGATGSSMFSGGRLLFEAAADPLADAGADGAAEPGALLPSDF